MLRDPAKPTDRRRSQVSKLELEPLIWIWKSNEDGDISRCRKQILRPGDSAGTISDSTMTFPIHKSKVQLTTGNHSSCSGLEEGEASSCKILIVDFLLVGNFFFQL